MTSRQQGQQIDLAQLAPQQLSQVKKQLDDEVQHLTTSYQNLRTAQQKFRECKTSIDNGVAKSASDKALLVPLTSSLYVPGTLADTETVLVDVGTGFFVEKSTSDAQKFYDGKIEELGKNIKDLENIVNSKANNLRVVEEVLRQKMLAGQGQAGAGAASFHCHNAQSWRIGIKASIRMVHVWEHIGTVLMKSQAITAATCYASRPAKPTHHGDQCSMRSVTLADDEQGHEQAEKALRGRILDARTISPLPVCDDPSRGEVLRADQLSRFAILNRKYRRK
ncbi:hypothetical protein AC578_6067 [Pseudocercospora eumusae]|uniref:Prefoldin subunit 5 n=1 Tax=Pseudocercospora eumusae TaxID=321146 RepID=A0A139HVM0_9PEZI|nr:hypothetical protein AC578_6067 [Pseudocercospora eumusae]